MTSSLQSRECCVALPVRQDKCFVNYKRYACTGPLESVCRPIDGAGIHERQRPKQTFIKNVTVCAIKSEPNYRHLGMAFEISEIFKE